MLVVNQPARKLFDEEKMGKKKHLNTLLNIHDHCCLKKQQRVQTHKPKFSVFLDLE